MLRKVLVCLMIVAGVGITSEASAQPSLGDHRLMVSEHTGIRGIGSILNRTFHPVQITSVRVPDSLLVGESGLFAGLVNVEHATLPIQGTWKFSDGTRLPGLNVRHAFAQPGRYDVTLHVANKGSEVSKTFEVIVQPNRATLRRSQ